MAKHGLLKKNNYSTQCTRHAVNTNELNLLEKEKITCGQCGQSCSKQIQYMFIFLAVMRNNISLYINLVHVKSRKQLDIWTSYCNRPTWNQRSCFFSNTKTNKNQIVIYQMCNVLLGWGIYKKSSRLTIFYNGCFFLRLYAAWG